MGVCLHHVETIVPFLHCMISSLYAVKNGIRRKNLHSTGLPYSWQTQCYKLHLCIALCL